MPRPLYVFSLLFVLLALSLPASLLGQTQLINSNLVVVGHVNTCTTGPTGTTGNAYACTLGSAITAYQPQTCYAFVADSANTGSASLNLHSLGAKTISKVVGGVTTALVANDIRAGQRVQVCYDQPNDRMQLQGPTGNTPAFSDLTGTAADAQVPDLNTLSTGLSTSQCVQTDGAGHLASTGSACSTGGAPTTATYWTATTEAGLSAEVNLGGLTSGLLKHTVSAGISTPATAVAGTDYVVPAGTVATASALTTDPTACGSNLFVTDIAAAGTLTCTQPAFSNLTGAATDAQVPDLNTLSTGLTVSQCVTTDGTGKLASTGSACGAGGGVTTDTIGRTAFYNATTTVDGAPGLTFATDGTTITAYADRITTLSASATLGVSDGPIIACDATAGAVTATLPDGTTTTQRRFTLVKIDASANACLMAPNATGTDTINGVAGTATLSARWDRYDVDLLSTAAAANWSGGHGIAGPLSVPQGGTGAATLTGLVQGNGTGAMTAVTSSTVGQVVRVTGTNTFAFGAVDLADTDAVTGILPAGNLPTSVVYVAATNAWGDGVKQTFNPNGTNAGLNIGAHTADPSTLANGDLWYDSTNNLFRARINGASVSLGAAGGTGDVDAVNITTTAPVTGGTTCAAGTCAFTLGVSASSETAAGVVELATAAETTTGTDTTRAIHPSGLATSTVIRSIYIPAGSMDVSGACAANATAALVTNGPKLVTIGCTDADADSIEFDWVMPDGWNAGTITVELVAFSLGNNNAEVFEMDFAGQCVSTGDTPTAHSTTGEQPASITWGSSTNREQQATTAAITLQGSCVAGDHVYMRGQVDATATTMTPMTDLKILGVKIEYTRVHGND